MHTNTNTLLLYMRRSVFDFDTPTPFPFLLSPRPHLATNKPAAAAVIETGELPRPLQEDREASPQRAQAGESQQEEEQGGALGRVERGAVPGHQPAARPAGHGGESVPPPPPVQAALRGERVVLVVLWAFGPPALALCFARCFRLCYVAFWGWVCVLCDLLLCVPVCVVASETLLCGWCQKPTLIIKTAAGRSVRLASI